MTEVYFPENNNLIVIKNGAFVGCEKLIKVDLSHTALTCLEGGTFSCATGLQTIQLPDTVETIENEAFYSCTSLTDINLPANIKTIEYVAFFDCGELVNLIIPGSITRIQWKRETYENINSYFEGCNKLPSETQERLRDLGYKWEF